MKLQLRWLTEREKSYAVNLGHSSLVWELKENSKNKITVVSSLVMNIERTDKNKKVGRKQFENFVCMFRIAQVDIPHSLTVT